MKNYPAKLLAAIGDTNGDDIKLGNISISREEVAYSISNKDNHYSADLINILLYPFNQQNLSIKTYPATTSNLLGDNIQEFLSQKEDYVFIPVNTAYDSEG